MKIINDIISKPAPWMYVLLVLCLLVIISTNSTEKKNLQAEIDSLDAEYNALETSTATTLEAMAGEIAVRDDAIAGLNNVITGMESDSAAVNARLNDSDALRGDLEAKVSAGEEAISRLNQELSDTTTLLDVCTASQTQ
tara:strand:+ start:10310 stop:10726 length:417 start_codon:yes stop_codon:yes gene_type:complete